MYEHELKKKKHVLEEEAEGKSIEDYDLYLQERNKKNTSMIIQLIIMFGVFFLLGYLVGFLEAIF